MEFNDMLSINNLRENFKEYITKSVDAVYITIVQRSKDIKRPWMTESYFKPIFTHQVFGDQEIIFGYRGLAIYILYLQNSFNCYVKVLFDESVRAFKKADLVPDTIFNKLTKWLPTDYSTNRKDFLGLYRKENCNKTYGYTVKKFKSFNRKNEYATYRLNICNLNEPNFKDFHQKFESLLVWFIDGASKIDINDEKWMIYYLYEENDSGSCKSPIGFCTIYKFISYPDLIRARISQFFILPSHQEMGLGTKLFDIIYEQLLNVAEIKDVTVESPSPVFSLIRDYHNCLLALNSTAISEKNIKSCYTEVIKCNLMNICKFGKDQCQKVYDILYYVFTDTTDPDELNELRSYLKKSIIKQHTKQYWTSLSRSLFSPPKQRIHFVIGDVKESKDPVENYMNELEQMVKKIREYIRNN